MPQFRQSVRLPIMAEEVAAAQPAVQEALVEAKLFGKWDFSDVEVRQPAALSPAK